MLDLQPIPHTTISEKNIKPTFQDQPFIQIIDTPKIRVEMMYPRLGFVHAEPVAYLREDAYNMLISASEKLPDGYQFVIWDAWRPFALQKELFEVYSKDIIRDFHLEGLVESDRVAFISQFVADPKEDISLPPAHTTGGAIDLTLKYQGEYLDFGTKFDEFTNRTETDWYERNPIDAKIQENRRFLYQIMTSVGFTNLPSEWWHYDFGDRNYSNITNTPAIYKGVFTKEDFI